VYSHARVQRCVPIEVVARRRCQERSTSFGSRWRFRADTRLRLRPTRPPLLALLGLCGTSELPVAEAVTPRAAQTPPTPPPDNPPFPPATVAPTAIVPTVAPAAIVPAIAPTAVVPAT